MDGPDDVAERVQGPVLGQLILARLELLCQESKISRLMVMSNRSLMGMRLFYPAR